jgi:hypothetical protein
VRGYTVRPPGGRAPGGVDLGAVGQPTAGATDAAQHCRPCLLRPADAISMPPARPPCMLELGLTFLVWKYLG